jgi:ribosome-associated protein
MSGGWVVSCPHFSLLVFIIMPKPKKSKKSNSVEPEVELVSKSQIKREMDALQKLGQALVALSEAQLATFTLDETLLEAIVLAQRIRNKHEAFRRQMQFIGKRMRHADAEAIELQLAHVRQESIQAKQQLQQLERLRAELLEQGDARLQSLMDDHPHLDRQALRQWIRQAEKEAKQSKPPTASRALFAYLRDHLY